MKNNQYEQNTCPAFSLMKHYFMNHYVAEALSGASMALTGSTVLFAIMQMKSPNTASAVSQFFEKNILNPILTEDYATLGFPMLTFLIGITALVLFGNVVDKISEKTCGLVTRLQNCNYLPKPGDQRIFLFILPFVYYPALPFSKSETKLFVAIQFILQTGNNALQLFSRTKENDFSLALKQAYANPAFCALMPMIIKMLFLMVDFILYFGQSVWENGIQCTLTTIRDFPNKTRFLYDHACLKKMDGLYDEKCNIEDGRVNAK